MPEYRVLLMDPFTASPSAVNTARDALVSSLEDSAPHINVTCILGTDEKDNSFSEQGSWDAWCTHVATGIDFEQRTPLFNAIAVMDERMGKATASIMSQALEAGRMGIIVNNGGVKRVVSVGTIDSEDWKAGWRAITE